MKTTSIQSNYESIVSEHLQRFVHKNYLGGGGGDLNHDDNHSNTITNNVKHWKNHPKLNPILEFETWRCPVTHLQAALKDEHIKPTLPYSSLSSLSNVVRNQNEQQDKDKNSRHCSYNNYYNEQLLRHIHPRIPIIQNMPTAQQLSSTTTSNNDSSCNHNSTNQDTTKNDQTKLKSKYKLILRRPFTVHPIAPTYTIVAFQAATRVIPSSLQSSSLGTTDAVDHGNMFQDVVDANDSLRSNNNNNNNNLLCNSPLKDVIQPGPKIQIPISYKQLSFVYSITTLLEEIQQTFVPPPCTTLGPNNTKNNTTRTTLAGIPKEYNNNVINLLPPPTSFEQVGHIAHFNLQHNPYHLDCATLIGSVLLESSTTSTTTTTTDNSSSSTNNTSTTRTATGRADSTVSQQPTPSSSIIDTVVTKVGTVSGPYRTYELQVMATRNNNSNSKYNIQTVTQVMEHGMKVALDLATCYWSTRLSGERQTLLSIIKESYRTNTFATIIDDNDDKTEEISSKRRSNPTGSSPGPGIIIADVFCGVGAMCLLAHRELSSSSFVDSDITTTTSKTTTIGKRNNNSTHSTNIGTTDTNLTQNVKIWANDWNPSAIEYFQQNIKGNGLPFNDFILSCQDSYDFLMDLGLQHPQEPGQEQEKIPDTSTESTHHRRKPSTPARVFPDHVLMNFPLEAPRFLGALRWWPADALTQHFERTHRLPRFHVYTFARADLTHDNQKSGRSEEEVAIDQIANHLIPIMGRRRKKEMKNCKAIYEDKDQELDEDKGSSYESELQQRGRGDELNDYFGCKVATRIVRDVAPGKLVVCVSFTATPKLIRHMQGDYFS